MVSLLTGKCVPSKTAMTSEMRVSETSHNVLNFNSFCLYHTPRTGLTGW